MLIVNDSLTLKIMAIRCQREGEKQLRWRVRLALTAGADFTIAAQLDEYNREIVSFYLLPMADYQGKWLPLPSRFDTPSALHCCRYAQMEDMFGPLKNADVH